ncbi:MAG: anthranilate synthase component I family protein [Bacteroidetes bacterium]|nr:anthranilate synthase component I family protein [Bacteroidota bacterium]
MWAVQIPAVHLQLLAQKYSTGRDLIWLDSSSKGHPFGRYSYLCIDPIESIPASAQIEDLRQTLNHHSALWIDDGPPFQGGLVGFFDYEFSGIGIKDTTQSNDGAHCHFRLYDTIIAVDHDTDLLWIISSGFKRGSREPCRATAQMRINAIKSDILNLPVPVAPSINLNWENVITKENYLKAVRQIIDFIGEGDIYQANFSQAFTANLSSITDIFHAYLSIRKSNPSPFSACGNFGDRGIACTSPERLITVDSHGIAEARPIKGTIKRSAHFDLDQRLKQRLLMSEKDRAENIMIVDLLRNDLSKVCKPHTVTVKELCSLESYAGLHQLTSSVQGEVNDDYDAFDLMSAVFPGGSVTGAPKRRSMEIINQLEQQPRRAFCGSMGYFGFNGAADFNIMIRTIQFDGTRARLDVGSGITALSDPEDEYLETLLKAHKIFNGTGEVMIT